jgi:hypothetical protein
MDIAQSRPKIAAWQILTGCSKTNPCCIKNSGENLHKNAAIASHTCHLEGLAFKQINKRIRR